MTAPAVSRAAASFRSKSPDEIGLKKLIIPVSFPFFSFQAVGSIRSPILCLSSGEKSRDTFPPGSCLNCTKSGFPVADFPVDGALDGTPCLCYTLKQSIVKREEGVMPDRAAFREPAGGASRQAAVWRLAPERGAPKSFPVGCHGTAPVIRAGLVGAC